MNYIIPLTMAARKKPELLKREPTADDEWCAMAYESAARAIARWLKGSINTQRPINSLKLPELVNIAQSAIHDWIVKGSEREAWVKANDKKKEVPPGFV